MSRIASLLLCLAAAGGAQAPTIGDIHFYGLRTISADRILAAAGLKPGGALPPSKGDIEDLIASVPGVVQARVEAVCCDGSAAALFIGIQEQDSPHAVFRSEPAGDVSLPQEMLDLYQRNQSAVQRADPAMQGRFGEFAASHLDLLRAALRKDPEADQRAIAAAVIGYTPRKAEIVEDLELASQDPDEAVRANALRAQ
jgi:hypothetical protein